MTKHLKDLREYIEALANIGEVQPIDMEVDPHLEVGGVIRRSYDLRAPAPLFNKVKNSNHGIRILGAPVAASAQPKLFMSRVAISLGMEPTATAKEIVDVLAELPKSKPIKPNIVASGTCKETILIGDDVDLNRVPAPQLNGNDGGPYFSTLGTIVSASPDGKWINWAIARVMALDEKRLVANVVPGQDTNKIRDMWTAIGKPMPFALFQGGPPVIPFVSGMGIAENISERDIIGGFMNEPLDLVKCETVDLEVPADAEIVIEGTFSMDETAEEGPMGEFSGSICLASKNHNPVLNVSAMSYRNDAILPVVVGGYPIEENHTVWALGISATIYSHLKEAGVPVSSCFIPFESAVHWLVVTIDREYIWKHKDAGTYKTDEVIDKIKQVLFTKKPGIWMAKILVIADDVDPSNIADVVWAFATRCNPDNQLIFPNESLPMPLVTFLSEEEKKQLKCTKTIYNCLRPDTWTQQEIPAPAKFESNWPEDVRQKVLDNWQNYGY